MVLNTNQFIKSLKILVTEDDINTNYKDYNL